MTPARLVLAAVASTVLGAMGGCAGPYALPAPLAPPTMAFPSQASSPLPAYAMPPPAGTGGPVSVTLDGGLPAASDATMTARYGDGDGAWLAEWLAADPRAPRDGVFRASGGQAFDTRGAAARRADGAVAVLPGGGWLRRDGNIYVRSDGSSTIRVGEAFFHSDGSWTRRSGDILLRSGGGSCRLTVETAVCREGR
ncbi:hypothetical protein J2847_005912 [Azospirillum agricola]|uniref:hypothetical protein n=1 Tax=Azospirillum agricola TaxID=1720247 RepID=UPI001AE73A1B|nr:hypothetical protein [Azospirillum agricola]MBP2232581.1 hypothetical protein [Azospirillum agricola]